MTVIVAVEVEVDVSDPSEPVILSAKAGVREVAGLLYGTKLAEVIEDAALGIAAARGQD